MKLLMGWLGDRQIRECDKCNTTGMDEPPGRHRGGEVLRGKYIA